MGALLHFALWAGLFLLMMRLGCGAHVMGREHDRVGDRQGFGSPERLRWVPPETDIDPVCGKTVHTTNAKTAVHDDAVRYFCSRECRERFEVAPNLYVWPNAQPRLERKDHAHG